MNLYTHISANKRSSWLLIIINGALLLVLGWVLSQAAHDYVWFYIALIYSLVSSLVGYLWGDKVVLMTSKAKLVDRTAAPELYRLVDNLCIAAGLPTPKIYVINEAAPNAVATGRDPKHATIAVTSGLLAKLDKTELEGVIAHELSHVGNHDILLATLVSVVVGAVALLGNWFARWSLWGGNRRSSNDEGGQISVIMSIMAIVLAILAPSVAQIIQLAISRRREFLADADGVLLTRYPEGLISALKKISADTQPLSVASEATAHLYFASPFDNKKRTPLLAKMFMTHPPVEERIAALEKISF